ncbi:hypothetical protein IWW48_005184 [Coemansia sp. RSA 1200]|nr:hypothetical protein IWW48_005184 [Coemansia sp. RSA 1200]
MLINSLRSQQTQCCLRIHQGLAHSAATHIASRAVCLAQQRSYCQAISLSTQANNNIINRTIGGNQLRAMSMTSSRGGSKSGTVVRMAKRQERSTGEKYTPYGEYHFRESIERARSPYSVRNGITALALMGLCTGIYFYSLNVVKQEDFSDVPMPPEPTSEEKAEFERRGKEEASSG